MILCFYFAYLRQLHHEIAALWEYDRIRNDEYEATAILGSTTSSGLKWGFSTGFATPQASVMLLFLSHYCVTGDSYLGCIWKRNAYCSSCTSFFTSCWIAGKEWCYYHHVCSGDVVFFNHTYTVFNVTIGSVPYFFIIIIIMYNHLYDNHCVFFHP